MTMLSVRNLPDDVHRAVRKQAALCARSTWAEVCEILDAAINPEPQVRWGDALAALSRDIGLTNEDFNALDRLHEQQPAVPLAF